jgi:hypothetical protein
MVLAQRVCAWALVLLGGIHMAFTAVVYKSWSLGAAWFLGTGVAFVVLGFLNLVSSSGSPRRTVWFCLIANLVALVYSIAVAAILQEPQGFLGVLLLLVVFGSTAHHLIATRNTKAKAVSS